MDWDNGMLNHLRAVPEATGQVAFQSYCRACKDLTPMQTWDREELRSDLEERTIKIICDRCGQSWPISEGNRVKLLRDLRSETV